MRIHDASSLPSRVSARVRTTGPLGVIIDKKSKSRLYSVLPYGPYNKDYQKRITSFREVALNYVLEFIQANKKKPSTRIGKRRPNRTLDSVTGADVRIQTYTVQPL